MSAAFSETERMDGVTGKQDDKAERLGDEVELIAAAGASVAAGQTVPFKAVQEWANSLGTDHKLPLPRPRSLRGIDA